MQNVCRNASCKHYSSIEEKYVDIETLSTTIQKGIQMFY